MDAERPGADIALLVAEHHQAVYRYAYRLTGCVPDAEDLTQQVFLAAQQKLEQLQCPDKARNWLFAMLRNSFLKGCQKRNRLPLEHLPREIDSLPAEIPSDEAIDREKLQLAINAMPPEYRVVLLMFYFEDLSYRDIASKLEIPLGTVMSRLARAKQQLRGRLFAPAAARVGSTVGASNSRRG